MRRGITEWLRAWKARGWRTADRKPVKNQDLWQRLDEAAAAAQIEWHWVPAHAGVPGNERVDRLANEAIDALRDVVTVDSRAMRQIVLDTETTGLEPELNHRIIEIGCVELREPPRRPAAPSIAI